VIHAVDTDDAGVLGEVPARLREPLAVEDRVPRPDHRERRDALDGPIAVRADEQEAVDAPRVRAREPARHRAAERVAADDPPIDLWLVLHDRRRLPLREHRQVRRHPRNEHRRARLLDDPRRRRQVRVRRHPPARIEHHAHAVAGRTRRRVQLVGRSNDDPAVRTLDRHVRVRSHRRRTSAGAWNPSRP
jgi:hypothetical protein